MQVSIVQFASPNGEAHMISLQVILDSYNEFKIRKNSIVSLLFTVCYYVLIKYI